MPKKSHQFYSKKELVEYIKKLVAEATKNGLKKNYKGTCMLGGVQYGVVMTPCTIFNKVGVGLYSDTTDEPYVNLVLAIIDKYIQDLYDCFKTIELFDYINIKESDTLYEFVKCIIEYTNADCSVNEFVKKYYRKKYYKRLKRGFSCSLSKRTNVGGKVVTVKVGEF